jgi:putative two-component system response regulator
VPENEMTNHETLLLVEDNHDLRNGLRDILAFEGYTVVAAVHGREALEKMRQAPPDLIISDIAMPEMNGYEFYDILRSRPDGITIPFIFLTARGEPEDVMKARHLGAEDYLVKPISRSDLLSAVRSKLNRFQQVHMVQLEQSYEASLTVLANVIEERDAYTRGHVERVRDYSMAMYRQLGLPDTRRRAVRFGAILHDIGKVLVRESTLTKPGALSIEEWTEIRQHPLVGAEMLKDIAYLSEAIPIIRHHHERWDGRGYPAGLVQEEIPIEARIVAVADSFDALTTTRSYHPAWSLLKAREEILRCSGTYFDPRVIHAFEVLWANEEIHRIASGQYNLSVLSPLSNVPSIE